jgi:hypothetical protein
LRNYGLTFVALGIVAVLVPFGPSLANPVVIPKADPNAGLGLLQALSPMPMLHAGVALALAGGLALLCSVLLRNSRSQSGGDGGV